MRRHGRTGLRCRDVLHRYVDGGLRSCAGGDVVARACDVSDMEREPSAPAPAFGKRREPRVALVGGGTARSRSDERGRAPATAWPKGPVFLAPIAIAAETKPATT
jgi:hypothetical protein